MSDEKPAQIKNINSPEYKKICMEWAIRTVSSSDPDKTIEAAKKFYAYVYGE